MKSAAISLAVLMTLALISFLVVAPGGGQFSVPEQRMQSNTCGNCYGLWDGNGSILSVIWESYP
ncbi:MAG: hypothetical protein ACO4AU_05275 [bacterium]|jgi:hypothetical protein